MTLPDRKLFLASLAALLLIGIGGVVYAQLEGADRGVAPIDSATTLEVTGIRVDVTAKTSEAARLEGWKQAQAKGWLALWAKSTGRPASEAPKLPESALNTMVSGIIVEEEQIGPTRYIATLGVLFDRARTGELLGVGGPVRRSAPMLVLPILQTGSTSYSFEFRNEWQRAWARLRTGGSAIDYVRVSGNGIDPLLLNAAQAGRPGRGWWRMLLDQYGAADVLMPQVRLVRSYPGGPARGMFTAKHGPDGRVLESFTLEARNSAAIPRMLDEGIRRLDEIYGRALAFGLLAPDPSLTVEDLALAAALAEQVEGMTEATDLPLMPATPTDVPVGVATSFSLQVDTPNAGSVSQAELSVSRIPGVTSALTTSLALGGTSVMKVTYAGDAAAFAAALQGQGWTVSGSGTTLRIARTSPQIRQE